MVPKRCSQGQKRFEFSRWPANHARMLPEQVYLIHTASGAVLLAHPLFLFGQRRVSAGCRSCVTFSPGGLSARNLSKPGRTILQQHNLGVRETHKSNLQWYAAPWQSQAKARSESSIVPEFFPPLVLVLVGLRRLSPRSQGLKPSYPIFAWGSNCHFSNQIEPSIARLAICALLNHN